MIAFPRMVNIKPGESVVFSYIVFEHHVGKNKVSGTFFFLACSDLHLTFLDRSLALK